MPRIHAKTSRVDLFGFTLIELLAIIAILAVLVIVVVLTLNPAGLLAESRDATRISDMATLTSALSYSLADNASESMGSANTVYVSLPDPTATSSARDQCQGLSLLTLPAGYTYQCAASSTYRLTNGNGWIPVNLQNNSFGFSLSELPIDPVNTSSSRHYYTYETDGNGRFEVTSVMESAKYQLGGSADVIGPDGGTLASVYEKGSKLGLEPLDYGDNSLVGFWSLSEGAGSTAYDDSGNGDNGTWSGTASGASGYYSPGKIGPWAGAFDGTSTYIDLGNAPMINPVSAITLSGWENNSSGSGYEPIVYKHPGNNLFGYALWVVVGSFYRFDIGDGIGGKTLAGGGIPAAGWHYVVGTFNGSQLSLYIDGTLEATATYIGAIATTANSLYIAQNNNNASQVFGGLIDDVRVYDRALTAPQIQAMYSAGK